MKSGSEPTQPAPHIRHHRPIILIRSFGAGEAMGGVVEVAVLQVNAGLAQLVAEGFALIP